MSALCICKNSRSLRLGMALVLGLAALLGLLWLVEAAHSPAMALEGSATIRYVDGVTGHDNGNDCIASTVPCATVQHAVDVAAPGDEIRVATGVYTGVHARAGITQVVYISKSVTVRGGYATTDWTTPYPVTQPTTLDAQKQGRVLYISGDISPTIEGLRITGGDAAGLGGIPSGSCGGGVLVTNAPGSASATVILKGNDVVSNNAVFGGGLCVYNRANVTLIGNTISGNNKDLPWTHAAGLCVRASSRVKLIANTISGNGSDQGGSHLYGGALFVSCDDVTLIGNVVSGNNGPNRCGGLCFHSSSDVALDGNVVVDNYAGAGAGGGLWVYNSDLVLTNTVIAGNRVGPNGIGSGLYIQGCYPRLLHATVARNRGGDGSGIYVTGVTANPVALTNTIVVSHRAGITVTANSTISLDGVLWYSNTINYGGEGTITVNNEYTGNPAFAADGYHLTSASAAIDKGVDAGVDDDIDGDCRDAAPDLGADESVYHVYLPLVLRSSG